MSSCSSFQNSTSTASERQIRRDKEADEKTQKKKHAAILTRRQKKWDQPDTESCSGFSAVNLFSLCSFTFLLLSIERQTDRQIDERWETRMHVCMQACRTLNCLGRLHQPPSALGNRKTHHGLSPYISRTTYRDVHRLRRCTSHREREIASTRQKIYACEL